MITPEQLAACGSESGHQKALMAWIAWQPDPCLKLAFAIPNGGRRDKITAARMKSEGVKRGIPDLMLPVASNGYHGLFIEMKNDRGRLSEDQEEWFDKLNAQGYKCVVCWSWTDARDALLDYVRMAD